MAISRSAEIKQLLANLRQDVGISRQGEDLAEALKPATATPTPGHTYSEIHLTGVVHEPGHLNKRDLDSGTTPVSTPGLSTSVHEISNGQSSGSVLRSSTPTVPDSSLITTWPAALRHVTKYVASNDKVTGRIKHMIREQRRHEREWWAGREAIIARHEGREDNQQKAAELIRSLGGFTVPVAARDRQSEQLELQSYDAKVHKSCVNLVADYDRQLRHMGIPFYAIKRDLFVPEDEKEQKTPLKGRLDRRQLQELQQKMTQLLEDLFGDDAEP